MKTDTAPVIPEPPARLNDYSLVGEDAALAVEKGLANAQWYKCPVPRDQLLALLERRDGPAIRDTLLWFGLLIGSGVGIHALWGTWWVLIPMAIYGVIYASTSDSRWHESGHGTAFKTDWMNNVLYEIASFMVIRESTVWRWSHARHHSDTLIVGRDREIAAPRPSSKLYFLKMFFSLTAIPYYFKHLVIHSLGKLDAEEPTYIPESEHPKVFLRARICLLIYFGVIVTAILTHSILPLIYIGLPNLYGAWLTPIYGFTQHAGLAENVLDHRLNCRTVYMNPINRYLYWEMNYHLEHHMFPLVPYHALSKLHALIKEDCPPAYASIADAYREIIPAVLRQMKDPSYYVRRELPKPAKRAPQAARTVSTTALPSADGWLEICPADALRPEDVVRFDHDGRTYAIYRTANDRFYATDGICTHGNAHLAEGWVSGNIIECAKHNGRFDFTDGSPQRRPVCVGLKTYPVRIEEGKVHLNLNSNN